MRLEFDLSADRWDDYKAGGDLKRVGVLVPIEPVGVSAFVRLGVRTDDGQAVTVLTPWLIWQAAHQALLNHFGERTTLPTEPTRPPVLDVVEEAMRQHQQKWGLDTSHPDGTDPEEWRDNANWSHLSATEAAMTGELTWAHTLLEAVHGALATEDLTDLSAALAKVAGAAANWIEAIRGRADG